MSNDINLTEGTITEILNNKVDIDFQNVPSNSVGFARCSTEVTNCITEIPQRIKYTLEDGTLTIKAGSVVIVPYGVEDLTAQYPVGSVFIHENFRVYDTQFTDDKFFVWAEAINDISQSTDSTMAQDRLHVIVLTTNSIASTANPTSGETDTTASGASLHYNTSINKVGKSANGSTTATYENICSLPILSGKSSTTFIFDTIDQVFNGMGYIGSTIWVDKGVKGLIPNGRNEDGSLKNIEHVVDELSLRTFVDGFTNNYHLYLASTNIFSVSSVDIYNKDTNISRYGGDIGTIRLDSDIISNFQPKLPFRAIDYSDKSEVSGWGMPSSKYIDLTLGASGSKYTAPANGWFWLSKGAKATGQNFCFYYGGSLHLYDATFSVSSTNGSISGLVPVKKGEIVEITYNLTGTTYGFKFIYAEGEI